MILHLLARGVLFTSAEHYSVKGAASVTSSSVTPLTWCVGRATRIITSLPGQRAIVSAVRQDMTHFCPIRPAAGPGSGPDRGPRQSSSGTVLV